MAFNEILAASWFKYGVLPCIATGVALLMKFNSRPDAKPSEREDWAVGFDLCQVSFFAILADGVTDAVKVVTKTGATEAVKNRLAELPWILFIMVLISILISLVVRKVGWDTPAGANPSPKLNRLGVILPIIFGLFFMVSAIVWLGGSLG